MEYNCALMKVDWLAACNAQRVVGTKFVIFLWYWHTICCSPANGKQGPIPDEMSQSLLSNKKQGNLD
jgi:hypothetical protein